MTTVSFVGDIMLARFVAEPYSLKPDKLVSEDVVTKIMMSDFCIANLESPISSVSSDDSLRLAANSELLNQFKWVDCFFLKQSYQ